MTVNTRKVNFIVISNWTQGNEMSGGDRIFIELTRRWIKNRNFDFTFFVSEEAKRICLRSGSWEREPVFQVSEVKLRGNYLVDYPLRTINSLLKVCFYQSKSADVIYSCSDFWPDSLAGLLTKLKNPKAIWIAGFYLFAAKPWSKASPYKGKSALTGFFYWFTQVPVYYIVKRFADLVFVTSCPDAEKFITVKRNKDRIVVVRGGVDVEPSKRYFELGKVLPVGERKYDACFMGRFHYQKGILGLIDIWRLVCNVMPHAKLALIGSGPLEAEIKKKIGELGLKDNIDLLGFQDGEVKYEVFRQSRIVLHPAIYDSGGMAAAEAMAWGLPGVSFDLEALKTYYPKGMLKIKCFDLQEFARKIVELLTNRDLYRGLSEESIALIRRSWDWDNQAAGIYAGIETMLKTEKIR